MMSEFKE